MIVAKCAKGDDGIAYVLSEPRHAGTTDTAKHYSEGLSLRCFV